MKLVKLTCPNCGANLKINNSLKFYKCEYCKTNITLDDEIKKVEVNVKQEINVKNSEYENAINELYELKQFANDNEYENKLNYYYNKYPKSYEIKNIKSQFIDYQKEKKEQNKKTAKEIGKGCLITILLWLIVSIIFGIILTAILYFFVFKDISMS